MKDEQRKKILADCEESLAQVAQGEVRPFREAMAELGFDRPNRITFTAHPIKTAPKDREIMVFSYGTWGIGRWCDTNDEWFKNQIISGCPTHWAEISDMAPKAAVPKEGEGA